MAQLTSEQPQEHVGISSLPMEVVDTIMNQLPAIVRNGAMHGVDYLYEDGVDRNGAPRIVQPVTTAFGQTCQKFRRSQLAWSFRNASVKILHNEVGKTVKLLTSLYPWQRDSIRHLELHYQKVNPVDYIAFHSVCRLLSVMPKLKTLHLTIPVNVVWTPRVEPVPGLYNALCWHANCWRDWAEVE